MMRRSLPLLALVLLLGGCDTLSDTGRSLERMLGYDKDSSETRLTGDRESILAQTKELQPDEALQSDPMSFTALPANAAWPQIGATAAGMAGNLAYEGTGDVVDSATIGGGDGYGDALVSPPIIASGMVFAMDGAGTVSAQSVEGLTRQWRSKAVRDEAEGALPGGGVAYARGRVVAVNGSGKIAALEANTGKKVWDYTLNLPVRTPPRIFGTTLLVQTADQQLYAFGLAQGNLLWRHRGVGEAAGLMTQTAPAANGNVVAVAYGSGDVMGLSADSGEEMWASSLNSVGTGAGASSFAGFSGGPAMADDIVYAGSGSGVLAAIDTRDGQRVWDQAMTIRGTPYIVGDYLFVVTMQDMLYAIHRADGKVRWTLQLPTFEDTKYKLDPFLWQGPVMAGGRLWLLSARGRILAVSAEKGEIVVDRKAPKKVRHAPVIALDRMWLLDADAKLRSVK